MNLNLNNYIQTFKPVLEIALEQNTQVTEIDLARLSGFNNDEINMLTLYWQPCFNNSWIYLSDELILENLTNETGKQAITNFYNQIMIPTYEKGNDYQEVLADNELVKFHYLKKINEELKAKPGNRKKYYIVTGEAYKCMLMASRAKKGKNTRKYYLKVERLAMTMKDYLVEKSKKETKKENQYLQNTIRCLEEDKLKKEEEIILTKAKEFDRYVTINQYEKKYILYVGYTGIRNNKLLFKYGRTEDVIGRMKKHKRDFPMFELLFINETSSGVFAESYLKREMTRLGNKTSHGSCTELFELSNAKALEPILECLSKHIETTNEFVSKHEHLIMLKDREMKLLEGENSKKRLD